MSSLKVKIFAEHEAILGEGPLWHPVRKSLFWVDILNKRLYEKNFNNIAIIYDKHWDLPEMASALAVDAKSRDILWMVTDQSFGHYSLESRSYHPKIKLNLPDEMRTNDGGVAPDGSFWFGTMQRSPKNARGNIYSISCHGILSLHISNIGIPNAFCWSNDGSVFYLSDSLRQQIFRYHIENTGIIKQSETIFLDLSTSTTIPDGAAMDEQGNLWNCHWDGSRVSCYDSQGRLLDLIKLPVPRPTSCCFGGPELRHLFITSATEGLNKDILLQYPNSGSVFVVELDVAGEPIPPFEMDLE